MKKFTPLLLISFFTLKAIAQAPVPNFTASITTICGGGNISFTDQSTNSPTSWNWSFPGGTPSSSTAQNPTVNYNTSGTFSVTLTASNGSGNNMITKPNYITITPITLTVTITPNNTSSCGFSDGNAYASVNGGATPYTFLWLPGNQTTPSINGLAAGSYSLNVTDMNGCLKKNLVDISDNSATIVTIPSKNNVTCNGGNNGGITANASSGTPPYTFYWSPGGQTNSALTGLGAGVYTLRVTDGLGCSKFRSDTIFQPNPITVSFSKMDVACNGGNNGSITASVSGGVSPYTYNWNTSATTQTITGLAAGSYTVNITDNAGCSQSAPVTIMQPPVISISINPTPVSCNGASNGSAIANVGGGTSPYTYNWSPSGQSTSAATRLTAGNYSVMVNDVNGCMQSSTITITQPAVLVANAGANSTICSGSSVTIGGSPTASGGTTPYTYSWNPPGGLNSTTIANPTSTYTSSLTYSVTITDGKGCMTSSFMFLTVNPSPTVTISGAPITICNGSNATLTAAGANTYAWNTGATTISIVANPTVNTSYTVTGTNTNGCSNINITSITVNPNPTITASANPSTICNGSSATLTATGGNTYAWNTGATNASIVVNPTVNTSYTVTGTNANGCSNTNVTSVTVNPNPSTPAAGSNSPVWAGQTLSLTASTISGASYSWNGPNSFVSAVQNPSIANVVTAASGNYSVTATLNGCTSMAGTTSVVVNACTPPTVTISPTNASCNGVNNGSAIATASNGIAPYT